MVGTLLKEPGNREKARRGVFEDENTVMECVAEMVLRDVPVELQIPARALDRPAWARLRERLATYQKDLY